MGEVAMMAVAREEWEEAEALGLPRQVKARMEAGGLRQAAVARELGVSAAAMSRWINGQYAGDVEAVDEKARRWLASKEAKDERAEKLVQPPDWVKTPTAVSIMKSLELAHYAPTMAIVYGGAGMGKTIACKKYRELNNNVFHITMNPAASYLTSALELILDQLRIRGVVARPPRMFAAITERLAGTSGLLIIDEAQSLSPRVLETIRAIYDETGIGLALVGNEVVYSRMTGGSRAAHFAQLFSRVGIQKHLIRPAASDVEAVASAMNIKGAKERGWLVEISKRPGALREVALTAQLAAQIAAGASERVNTDHLRAAYRMRGGGE